MTLVEWRDLPDYERIEEHGHIVRGPTQVKSQHNAEDELHCLGTGVWNGSEQAPKNTNVAKSDGNEGNEEEDVLQVSASQPPCDVVIIAETPVV